MHYIIEAIDRYISHRMYHYALMINGKWGCGKTYFIQNELIPHLNNNKLKDVNYLSLYGVRTIDEISQMLCVQAIKDKMGKAGKLADTKGGQLATVIITAATKFGVNKIGAENADLEKLIEIFPDYSNNVIIFDDLERCCCDISEVLGYINNFVEHSDAAVIIVANEEEIGKWQLDRNPEMQMLVALDNRIDADVEPTKKEYIQNLVRNNNGEKRAREIYSLKQLEQRRKTIFHSNDNYKRIKEKVIGQTIDFEPDLKEVFTVIIEKSTQEAFHDVLFSMIEEFVSVALREQHENLRTFQFFLEKASVVFDTIKEYEPLYQTILIYCYNSCVRYMKGLELPIWDGDYGIQYYDAKIPFSFSIMGFKFIDELIAKNQFDKEQVQNVVAQFTRIAHKKGQFSDDPYQLIQNWYLVSDDDLKSWLVDIEQNVRSGKYSTELYTSLIKTIARLKSYNVMTDLCENIFVAMKDYIEYANPADLEELESEHFIDSGNAGEIFKKYRSEIEKRINAKKKQSEKQIFEDAIKMDAWGTELHKLASTGGSIKGHSSVYWLDPIVITQKIYASKNEELQQFRDTLQCYYDGHIYFEAKNDDIEHLTQLRQLLNDADKEGLGQIQKLYYEWIIGDIDRYLTKLKPEVEEKR